jgi:ankyrin repeat protein
MLQKDAKKESKPTNKTLRLDAKKPAPEARPKLSKEDQEILDEKLLAAVASNNSTNSIKQLLDAGANPNAAWGDGQSALMYAAYLGNAKTCALLIRRGANVNAANEDKDTPLLIAARQADGPTCAILILNNADTKAVDDCGDTAFDIAAVRSENNENFESMRAAVSFRKSIGKKALRSFLSVFAECVPQ